MNKYIVDSNILLDYPQFIENTENKIIIISTSVLRELDGLKKHINSDIAFNARRAAIYISKNMDNIKWDNSLEHSNLSVDDQLIQLTQHYNGILLTNDVYLKVKASLQNLETEGFSNKDDYTGVYYWIVNLEEEYYHNAIDSILTKGEKPNELNLYENEYLIIKNINEPFYNKKGEQDYQTIGEFVYKDNMLIEVKPKRIKNVWINQIFPKNAEQKCLFDALNNTENMIIYAGGCYGSGKSFILNNFALQELQKQTIKKIVYIPNNSYVEGSMELGFLPGSDVEKTIPSIGPLIDLVGLDYVNQMIAKEELEIVPLAYIRGRSFQDSIIIVNEAQNLTEDHLKLLIARCGEGTRIFFDGDIKQADSQLFRNKNGLKLLMSLRKSSIFSKIFATVNLISIERSLTAQAADYLDMY